MSRRTLLAGTFAAATVPALTKLLGAAGTSGINAAGQDNGNNNNQRPNILFIIADDWSFPHLGTEGMETVETPTMDRLAEEGVNFTRAFCPSPSCSPCRASILTGQTPNRLDGGNVLSGPLPEEHPRYPDLLRGAGYHVGFTGKGYGPAWLDEEKDRKTGGKFASFEAFLSQRQGNEGDAPFAFWYGSLFPHRPYFRATTERQGVRDEDVEVPPFLPDTPESREDLAAYFAEIAELDEELAGLLEQLDATGQAENTIVVICSDNGMPFARAKSNLYDKGTHSPCIVRWPARVEPGQRRDEFVNLADFAPTFLEAAGVDVPDAMNAVSLMPLLTGQGESEIGQGKSVAPDREAVYLVREQHVPHADGGGYSTRGLRTPDYLYLVNLRPDRWPAGPPNQRNAQFPNGFVDVDEHNHPEDRTIRGGGSKEALVRDFEQGGRLGTLALGHRPAEELYVLADDPEQMNNVADDDQYAEVKRDLSQKLRAWMQASNDQGVTRPAVR